MATFSKRLLWMCGILGGLSLVAAANPIDPDILIDPALFDPTPIAYSTLSTLTPGAGSSCGVTCTFFEIFNDTNHILNTFTFSVDLPGLVNVGGVFETPDHAFAFSCPSDGGDFFLSCGTTYSGSILTFDYSGVNVDNPVVSEPCDTEVGEKEGIPVAGQCTSNALVGHVFITFDGWNGSANGVDLSTVSVAVNAVPEPATLPMLAIGVLGLASLGRRKIRQRN